LELVFLWKSTVGLKVIARASMAFDDARLLTQVEPDPNLITARPVEDLLLFRSVIPMIRERILFAFFARPLSDDNLARMIEEFLMGGRLPSPVVCYTFN
jgi:hypothetical protein